VRAGGVLERFSRPGFVRVSVRGVGWPFVGLGKGREGSPGGP
jgi:hypothetical protein